MSTRTRVGRSKTVVLKCPGIDLDTAVSLLEGPLSARESRGGHQRWRWWRRGTAGLECQRDRIAGRAREDGTDAGSSGRRVEREDMAHRVRGGSDTPQLAGAVEVKAGQQVVCTEAGADPARGTIGQVQLVESRIRTRVLATGSPW